MKAKKISAAIVVAAAATVAQQVHAQMIDGTVSAGEYQYTLATQTDQTGFGKGYNELDAAYANVLSDGTIQIMFTGNLEDGATGSGNGFCFFVQTRNDSGTINHLNNDGTGVLDDIGGARTYKWGSANSGQGSILSAGFNPNFVFNINQYSNTFYTDIVDTRLRFGDPARETYLGSNDNVGTPSTYTFSPNGVASGSVTTGFNNSNRTAMLGVNGSGDATLGDPTSNPYGWEFLLSPQFLHAKPGQEIRFLPFITNNDGGYLSNQFLFNGGGLPYGTGNLGYNAPLFDSRTWGSNVYVAVPQPTAAGAGDMLWNDDSQWSTQHAPNGANTTAILGGTKNVNLDTSFNTVVGAVIFQSGATTLNAGTLEINTFGDHALLQVNSGNHVINSVTQIDNASVDVVVGTGGQPSVSMAPPPSLTLTSALGNGNYDLKVSGQSGGVFNAPWVYFNNMTVDTVKTNITGASPLQISSSLTVTNGGQLNASGDVTAGSVNLSNGAKMALTNKVTIKTSQVSVDATSTLDIGTGAMIVPYTSGNTSPAAGIRASIAAAYDADNSGAWDLPGITSSVAAADSNYMTAVGYAEASDLAVDQGGLWNGQIISDEAVLVKYTYYGDSNLDGVVTTDDYFAFVAGFNGQGSGWAYGDYNYDGVIDTSDLFIFVPVFNANTENNPLSEVILNDSSLTASQKAAFLSVVPEPGTLALAVMAGVPMLTRRRRNMK